MAYTSINDYLHYEASLNEEDKRLHFREDYQEADQAWAEYLDYIDEWQYAYKFRLNATVVDFIFSVLIKHQVRMHCNGHTHIFVSDPKFTSDIDNIVLLTSIDQHINAKVCWYEVLSDTSRQLTVLDSGAKAPRLSVPEAQFIKRATQMNLMIKDGQTHKQLDFDQFKSKWWTQESKDLAFKIFNESETPLVTPTNEIINLVKEDLHVERKHKGEWLGVSSLQEDNILTSDQVCESHGFHLLLKNAPSPRIVLSLINGIRRRGKRHSLIDEKSLLNCVLNCQKCNLTGNNPTSLPSPFGIYYAPPGNGKTHALDEGFIVGVDTDWLNHSSTFDVIIKPFLDNDIPVITNQYDLIPLSGYRLFGIFNNNSLRTNGSYPFTSITEIVAAERSFKDDLLIFHVNNYFSDNLLLLYLAQFVYDYSKHLLEKQTRIKFHKVRSRNRDLTSFHALLATWANISKAQKRAKWSKFKKKHPELLRP
jgi:hypothetical protein